MTAEQSDPQTSESPPASPRTMQRRRSSFAELFASRPSIDTGSTSQHQSSLSSAMSEAQAQAQDATRTRRLSITTLGLSGSPSHNQQTSPFSTLRRGKAMNVYERPPEEDSAIEESEDAVPPMSPSRSPPVARRVSFGARQAYNARSGSVSQAAGVPLEGTNGGLALDIPIGGTNGVPKGNSPPGMRKSSEGFSWTENFRNRAQRASVSAASGSGGIMSMTGGGAAVANHNRSKSSAVSEPTAPKPPAPVKTPPKAPDHFQERILKGDFYMD